MLQNNPTYYTINHKQRNHRPGLVFALPQPVINSKDALKTQGQNTLPHHNIIYGFSDHNHNPEPISKKLKKIKEKSRSMLEISHKDSEEEFDKQKYRETLYKKWMKKPKRAEQSPQNENQPKKQKNYNVHLRKLNLVVLSKRQQLKKNLKSQEKQKQVPLQQGQNHSTTYKQRNGFSLPNFARAKSTFSKSNFPQSNTLAFLSKTIFEQIQSHIVTRFHKHKPVQPLELGITKAKLMSKKQNKYLEKRRRHRQNFNLREFEIKAYDVKGMECENINKAKISKHKKTELKGWQQEEFDQQNFPLS